jgi:cyclophilin family peptidyl-prolyl cis-trans isomerase
MKLIIAVLFLTSIASAQSVPTQVEIKTTMGNITVELDSNTPITSNNFYKYASDGFYNGQIFHRVISGFVIQAGGFKAVMTYMPPTYTTIVNESSFAKSNLRGTIAMARTRDPNSAQAQFYFNLVDNTKLDIDTENDKPGYCVFGEIIQGIEVIDSISKVPTGDRIYSEDGEDYTFKDVPVYPILILEMVIK